LLDRSGRRQGRETARKKIPCEWRKAGESRRAEAGLSEERKPKRAERQKIMMEEVGRCERLPE
jgi:hypothetical protein